MFVGLQRTEVDCTTNEAFHGSSIACSRHPVFGNEGASHGDVADFRNWRATWSNQPFVVALEMERALVRLLY
jgi:hypothetical protein